MPEKIGPTDDVYRRLAELQVNDDGTVNSSAFKRGNHYDHSISVDLARLTSPQESVDRATKKGFKLGVFKASHAISLRFKPKHSPEPKNYSHSLLRGHNDRRVSRALAKGVTVLAGIESRSPSVK